MLGQYYWNLRSSESLRKAVEFFEKARAIDPSYAQAYSGLARAYTIMADWSMLPKSEAVPKATAYAHRALELDPRLEEAYAVLAWVTSVYEHDAEEGERLFKRALELNPNYATAHQWYGEVLGNSPERMEESLAAFDRALELDPYSLIIRSTRANQLWFMNRNEEAQAELTLCLAADPDYLPAFYNQYYIFKHEQEYDSAVAAFLRTLEIEGEPPESLTDLRAAYNEGGFDAFCRRLIDVVSPDSSSIHIDPVEIATWYVQLGQTEEALEWIEKAYEERSVLVTRLRVFPLLAPIRDEPRFQEIVRKVGY